MFQCGHVSAKSVIIENETNWFGETPPRSLIIVPLQNMLKRFRIESIPIDYKIAMFDTEQMTTKIRTKTELK